MATENNTLDPIHEEDGGIPNLHQSRPYADRFQNAVKAALSDCHRLIRLGTDPQAPEALDFGFIDKFRKEVLYLFYGIGAVEIADHVQADHLFWKPFESLKKRLFKENGINRSHPRVQQLLSLFDEARDCLLDSRDYISHVIAPSDSDPTLSSGKPDEDRDDSSAGKEAVSAPSYPLDFVRERERLVKRWNQFLDFLNPFLFNIESELTIEILIGEITHLVRQNLSLLTDSSPEDLIESHCLLYESLIDHLETISTETPDFGVLSIMVKLTNYLMSSLSVPDEKLKGRLKKVNSFYTEAYLKHPDFSKPSSANGNGPIPESPEPVKVSKPAKIIEKSERKGLPSALAQNGKSSPESKRSPQYHIRLAEDSDVEDKLKNQFEATSVFYSPSRRETFNQLRFYTLFELSGAMVDLIIHLDHKQSPKGLVGKLNEIRSQSGVIDLTRVYRAFVSELDALGKILRRNDQLTSMAIVTFDEMQRFKQLEQAFATMLSAVFGLDVKHAKRWVDQITKDNIIDFSSRFCLDRFTGSRYSHSTEELSFAHVQEAARLIVYALQGSEAKAKGLKNASDDFQVIDRPKATAALHKLSLFPDEDLMYIERELLALLKRSPLYNARKAEEWILKLTESLNGARYQGQPKYSAADISPLVMRLIADLKEGKRHLSHSISRPSIAEAKPLGDYLASFSEAERREIKDNQGWMERVILIHSKDERLHFEKRLIQALFETAYCPEKIQLLHPSQIRFLTTIITQMRKQTGEFSEMRSDGSLYWSIKELDPAALGGIVDTLLREYRGADSRFPIVNQANELMLRQQELIESCERNLAKIDDPLKAYQEKRDEQMKAENKISILQGNLAAVKSERFNFEHGNKSGKGRIDNLDDFDRLIQALEAGILKEKELLSGLGVDDEAHKALLERKKQLEEQRDKAEMKLIQINLEFGELMEKFSDSK